MFLHITKLWLSKPLIDSLAWTFVHSLWQGLIAALIVFLMLRITRRYSPNSRYSLLVLVFAVFIVTVTGTFSNQYSTSRNEGLEKKSLSNSVVYGPSFQSPIQLPLPQEAHAFFIKFSDFVSNHTNIITPLWFVVFCMQCLRLCFSIASVSRIRYNKTYTPSTTWIDLCARLRLDLAIRRPVSILESGTVSVPVVVGFLKPVVLIPISMFANIPYGHVEAILLHELAHIKRNDYLVNVVQSLVETIFFFNPAILWISSLIKKEREACCDEMAVKKLGSSIQYIEALVSFQEFALNTPCHALGFPGRGNHLLQRIKRILNNRYPKLAILERLILSLSTIAFVTLFFTHELRSPIHLISKSVQAKSDTIPPATTHNNAERPKMKKPTRTQVTTNNSGKSHTVEVETNSGERSLKATVKDNRLIKVAVDGRELDYGDFMRYEQEIRSIISENQISK